MDRTAKHEEIEALKEALEEAMGQKLMVSGQFDQLREYVFNHTGEYVSSTTLKRLWGYLNEKSQARESTLSLLAQTLGFSTWGEFLHRNDGRPIKKRIPSNPKLGKCINVSSDLLPGDRIQLFWYPGRECLVEYLGGIDFRVIESEKTRLKPGDTFSTHLIVAGHPLYLSNLVRNGQKPMAYICGKLKGGVQFRTIFIPREPQSQREDRKE